jgi:hypothetical protein
MDGIVLEVRNQEGRCCTWNLVTTTSHVLGLRLVLPQGVMIKSLSFCFKSMLDLSKVVLAYRSLSTKCTPWFTSIIDYHYKFASPFLQLFYSTGALVLAESIQYSA